MCSVRAGSGDRHVVGAPTFTPEGRSGVVLSSVMITDSDSADFVGCDGEVDDVVPGRVTVCCYTAPQDNPIIGRRLGCGDKTLTLSGTATIDQ